MKSDLLFHRLPAVYLSLPPLVPICISVQHLHLLQQEQQAESIDKLRAGESASWGQQIRNYVLQPYKLVKDTRTKYESKEPEKILDGDLEGFINAYLESAAEK